MLVICLGKRTYARCGMIVNVTPLEPEWEGHVTLEITNTTPLPARIYAHEGICQFLFLQGNEPCETSYADKGQIHAPDRRHPAQALKDLRPPMDRILIGGGMPLEGTSRSAGRRSRPADHGRGLLTERARARQRAGARRHPDHEPAAGSARHRRRAHRQWRTHPVARRRDHQHRAPYDLVRKMRASVLVLGPLLARTGEARVSHAGRLRHRHAPGRSAPHGHGADGGDVSGSTAATSMPRSDGRLSGATIVFPFASVGATENLLMAASLAEGRTILCKCRARAGDRRPRATA